MASRASDADAASAGPDEPSGSPLKAVTNAVDNGPIASSAVTWGLVGMSTLGAIGAVMLRRHRDGFRTSDDESDSL